MSHENVGAIKCGIKIPNPSSNLGHEALQIVSE